MEQLAELEVEREHQADREDRQAHDDRSGAGQQRLEERRPEPPDPPPAPLGAEQRQVEDLERAEETDIGQADPSERRAPTGARPLAGSPFEVPARAEEQERQGPPARLQQAGGA